ncbi:OmpA/MotB family protein [Burkholderia ubonensis]|uniref:Motility protein B n=1 Tax=Burkholderia ubonensis TaxID=101571 RepID=A0AB74DEF3_9BURK|nr:OmpA family protein [Burkholderia ubonensis]PAJ79897.1 motility protein B [Burkholderia ubonensis]PAJ90129.1 motility protein B [Burkholderia ubonensis]PAJ96244.1 motility protein B [Burkholderia ubonensis]PAK03033.1 motility protein B [Burkholderia ubonensis]PAK07666.1 motility protein B [Burkholderia ubonensis]
MYTQSGSKRLAADAADHDADGEGAQSGRWLISYADLVTTLMVLFLALYVLQLAKYNALDVRFQALAQQAAGKTKAPAHADAAQAWSALLKSLKEQGQVTVVNAAHGVEIGINAKILFNVGDAQLLPDASGVLARIAGVLKAHPSTSILVEGHTDSVPISTAKYESNWELSSARAGAVVRYLVERGVEPHRLAAIGRADNLPLVAGDDAAARAMNRRVTILVQY